jgi:hypothetical protein
MKLRDLLERIRPSRTSLADRDDYLEVCAAASRDPAVFDRFKREPAYTRILEHVTEAQGRDYLEIIRVRYPGLLEQVDRFRVNDRHGDPVTFEYDELGPVSPSTLRYMKVLGDLEALFGDLGGLSIVEIGGGYGGQCTVIHARSGFERYLLVDLEPCARLAGTYLDRCGVPNAEAITMDRLPDGARFDLAISNYAWSECTRKVQEAYLERVLLRSARGYMTCNEITPDRFGSFGREELLSRLPDARVLPEEPLTRAGNYIVTWGGRGGAAR